MKPWIICSYYTEGTFYEDLIKTFKASLDKFELPYFILPIINQRDWYKNTNYKPTFLLDCLKGFPTNIIWVDVDAEFKAYPTLFDALDCNVGAFEFDQNIYYKHKSPHGIKELLSGTVYLKNCAKTIDIVTRWKNECDNNIRVWDQKSLQKVVGDSYYKLPGEYCCIDQVMTKHFPNPVIVHYQASRRVRKNKSLLTSGIR